MVSNPFPEPEDKVAWSATLRKIYLSNNVSFYCILYLFSSPLSSSWLTLKCSGLDWNLWPWLAEGTGGPRIAPQPPEARAHPFWSSGRRKISPLEHSYRHSACRRRQHHRFLAAVSVRHCARPLYYCGVLHGLVPPTAQGSSAPITNSSTL